MSTWLMGEWGGEMLEWLTNDENDAIAMLKRDHDAVKELFDQFEKAERRSERHKIAKRALAELRLHSTLEEEIFYPAVREQLKNGVMNEADEEHHVAKLLIAELDAMDDSNDHYDAKFTVLAESVRHHIKEEENQMLPKARDLQIDFQALGEKMARRKEALKANGLPTTSEDAIIRAQHRRLSARPKARRSPAPSPMKKAMTRKRSSNSRRG